MLTFPAPSWSRAEPIAPSDTTDNLGGDAGMKAVAIVNRSASNMLVSVAFAKGSGTPDEYTRVIPIPAHGDFNGGSRWIRVNATGTTGGGTSGVAYEGIHTSDAGLAFTNQPANDGLELLSAEAADTTQTVTVYGTTQGADTVVAEEVELNGTTPVATSKTDWGVILGAEVDGVCAGDITIREASGNQAVATIDAGELQTGVETVSGGTAYNVIPVAAADGATTKQIGLYGTAPDGTARGDSQALTGATVVAMNLAFGTITKVLTGDIEATRTVTISNSTDLLALY